MSGGGVGGGRRGVKVRQGVLDGAAATAGDADGLVGGRGGESDGGAIGGRETYQMM